MEDNDHGLMNKRIMWTSGEEKPAHRWLKRSNA